MGPRNKFLCSPISTSKGNVLPWVSEIRYLGVYIKQSRNFKRSIDHANDLPILLYGLEACPLNKTNLRSLDFSVNRFFVKLFKTSDMHIVTEIQLAFGFRPPSDIITDRIKTLLYKIYKSCDNQLHKLSQLPL